MKYENALAVANGALAWLEPHCDRIEIAGSIRRKRPEVGDVELVCIPKKIPGGLFGQDTEVCQGFVDAVNTWSAIKGSPGGRYTQRVLPGGILLDLFIADEENWGYQLAIRTGSADYSHNVLAKGWCRAGCKGADGYLTRRGKRVVVPEEKHLFWIIGIPWVEPEMREWKGEEHGHEDRGNSPAQGVQATQGPAEVPSGSRGERGLHPLE